MPDSTVTSWNDTGVDPQSTSKCTARLYLTLPPLANSSLTNGLSNVDQNTVHFHMSAGSNGAVGVSNLDLVVVRIFETELWATSSHRGCMSSVPQLAGRHLPVT